MGLLRTSTFATLLALPLWHCARARVETSTSGSVAAEAAATPVPAAAPDTVPDWIYADSNLVALPDWYEGALFIRDQVGVVFRPGTPVAERQAAVDRVGGVVIGGTRPSSGEGIYYVRLPHNTSNSRVFAAIAILRATPGVLSAVPGMVLVDPFQAAENSSQDHRWPLLTNTLPQLDTERLVQLPSGRWLYRANITLRFKDNIPDSAKIALLNRYHMTVVGVTRSGQFFVGIPDPGPRRDSLFSLLERLRKEPDIFVAASLDFSPLQPTLDTQGDTTRPPVPPLPSLPSDSTFTVENPRYPRSHLLYYRNIVRIAFDDSTSGTTIRNIFSRYRANLIGGIPSRVDPEYFLQVPDPGATLAALDSLLTQLNREPGVKWAASVTYRTPASLHR